MRLIKLTLHDGTVVVGMIPADLGEPGDHLTSGTVEVLITDALEVDRSTPVGMVFDKVASLTLQEATTH